MKHQQKVNIVFGQKFFMKSFHHFFSKCPLALFLSSLLFFDRYLRDFTKHYHYLQWTSGWIRITLARLVERRPLEDGVRWAGALEAVSDVCAGAVVAAGWAVAGVADHWNFKKLKKIFKKTFFVINKSGNFRNENNAPLTQNKF